MKLVITDNEQTIKESKVEGSGFQAVRPLSALCGHEYDKVVIETIQNVDFLKLTQWINETVKPRIAVALENTKCINSNF